VCFLRDAYSRATDYRSCNSSEINGFNFPVDVAVVWNLFIGWHGGRRYVGGCMRIMTFRAGAAARERTGPDGSTLASTMVSFSYRES
jgi:hypothetical protein